MVDTPKLKIIICGGGIAGFATALLLREHHNVTVLESSELNQELGAAITLSMNASRLLQSSLARAGFDKDKARYVGADKFQELNYRDLTVINEMKTEFLTAKYNSPWWYFSRKDLHSELKRAALSPEGLGTTPRLHLGAHVDRVDLESRTVFLRSGESFQGDVIVGADGIRSSSGNSVFGKLTTESQGLSAYRCMIASDRLRQDPDTAALVDCAKVMLLLGPDRRVIAYPCSSWDWINIVCIFPDSSERRVQWDNKVSVAEMVEAFKEFHPSVVKALSMATDTGVWQLRDRRPLSSFVKGCYVMIGDAAHAMGPHLGQGGCQSIEDAEALRIVLIGASQMDVPERLNIFDELRVGRANQIIEYSRAMAPRPKDAEPAPVQMNMQAVSDYGWRYRMTDEGVRAMNEHGYPLKVDSAGTGEILSAVLQPQAA